MEIHLILSHPPLLKLRTWIQLIGPHSTTMLSLRQPNFFTSIVKCQLQRSIPWWNCGQHIQHCEILRIHPLQLLCPSTNTGTCMIQLMQYQLVAHHGKVFLSHMTVLSLRIPPHGWKLNTWYSSGILAYSSRICWITLIFKTQLIMHHFSNMIQMTNVATRILCQVTGHGNKL